MTSPPRRTPARPRRRDILAGSLALAALRARPARAAPPPPPASPVEVDVHCHTFSAADLPIVGFVAHMIPGLTDLTRELTRWPERVVRELVGLVTKLPNAATPTAAAEIAALEAALARGDTIRGIPPLPDEIARALLDKALSALPVKLAADTRDMLVRYVTTLYLVSHGRAALAATLVETYPTVTLFTPSLVDYDEWSEDRAPTELADQIAIQGLIARLSIQGHLGRAAAPGSPVIHPVIHPFVAFDPRREVMRKLAPPQDPRTYKPFGDGRVFEPARPYKPGATPTPAKIHRGSGALEMVRFAVESNGFVGVKVYPPVGFAPWDNAGLRPREPLSPRVDLALQAFYAYCEAEEVPITAHTSAGNEYAIGFHELVSPDRWRPVLEAHPNLRVNFGHFGHDFGLDGPRGASAGEAWIRQASSLIQAYPNVYADLSNSPLVFDTAYATRLGGALREIVTRYPKVRRRLMYGSDWWLNRLQPGAETFPAAIRSALSSAHAAATRAARLWSDEEVADVMGRNALRFLGFLDDENRPHDGRGARRLRELYGRMRVAAPPWLG